MCTAIDIKLTADCLRTVALAAHFGSLQTQIVSYGSIDLPLNQPLHLFSPGAITALHLP